MLMSPASDVERDTANCFLQSWTPGQRAATSGLETEDQSAVKPAAAILELIHQFLAILRHHERMQARRKRGRASYQRGIAAEDAACAALMNDGWTILGRRLLTKAGEIDAVAEKAGILAIIEVKARPTLAAAATALENRQRTRLLGACDIILGEHPDWGPNGVRFDIIVVDPAGRVRRITDAFREGDL